MNKLFILLSFLVCLNFNIKAQEKKNYLKYHQMIIQIEEILADEKFEDAINQYKLLFQSYDFVFARDAFNACQIAYFNNNHNAPSFIIKCAYAGVPKNTLLSSPYIAKVWDKSAPYYDSVYKKQWALYISRINLGLRNEFIARYKLEQANKGMPDYKEICYDNFKRILQLAQKGAFPGEQQIGVNDDLEIGFILATLKHYPYSYRILYQQIEKGIAEGNILPISALYVYGFNQTRTSILNTRLIPVDTTNFKPCYNIAFGKQSTDIETVNKQRKSKFVAGVEVHQKIEALNLKYQLDYKFGY